ncbi:MAG: sodium:solute symporter [Planctomycetales bacterium]|nr:sodium:solute symporter [Planctomycetales bacterium]
MGTELRTLDLIVLLLYMAGVFALGCWFSRKSSNTEEFMAAGRSLPGWAVGLSIFGTYVSSIGFLGNTGKAFGDNWNSWVFGLSLPLAALVAMKWFIPLYRSSSAVSAYEHLEIRFGLWARYYALACYLLTQLARVGTILYLVALALAPLTGWNVISIIFVTGLLVTFYTLVGGIEAVIWTDVAQSIVLTAGAVLCALVVLFEMPEGPGQMFAIAHTANKFSLGSFSLAPDTMFLKDPTFWIVILYGTFINLQNFGIDQSFVQRYVTAKTDRDASFSVWLAALMFPIVSCLFFFIGTGLYSLYHADTQLLDEVRRQVAEARVSSEGLELTEETISAEVAKLRDSDIGDREIGDKVLPHFIVRKLPAGLAGLMIAAIFAAAMSSMDTSLNSSATLVLCDIWKRLLRPKASEREAMIVLYASTLFFGVVGTFTALAMIRVKSALDVWWNLQGMFTGGMLGLFLLGLICRHAKNAHAILAAIVGILLILWLSLSNTDMWPENLSNWKNPFHSFLTIIFGTSSIVLIGTVLASIIPANNSARISSRFED